MKLTHHGHSCLEIDVAGVRLLVDPGTFSEFDEVAGLDAIVVTHQHPDHLDPDAVTSLAEKNPDAQWFADPQTAAQLAERGIDATATSAGATYDVKGVTVEGVGSTHAEIHPYIDRVDNVGVVVSAPDEPRVFHPGDSFEATPADIDHLCVPIVAPWSSVKETIAFVRAVEPKHVVPIHDKIVAPAARGIFLGHIEGYGLDGGVDVLDVAVGKSVELSR